MFCHFLLRQGWQGNQNRNNCISLQIYNGETHKVTNSIGLLYAKALNTHCPSHMCHIKTSIAANIFTEALSKQKSCNPNDSKTNGNSEAIIAGDDNTKIYCFFPTNIMLTILKHRNTNPNIKGARELSQSQIAGKQSGLSKNNIGN